MRGDSIRDLYAKMLALIGLGVLAGVGALVDSWPLGMARNEAPAAGPAAPAPVATTSAPQYATANPHPFVARPLARHRAVPDAIEMRASAEPLAVPASFSITTPGGPLGRSVGLGVFSAVEPAADMLVAVATDLSVSVADDPPAYLMTERLAAPVSSLPDSANDDGLITSAFRKTGSSIVKTGIKTGSSIYDAVRGLSGAMRRVLPVI
ncbi:MAG: hypothetical protein ABI051_09545 [Vicinamibacterales bacterium]